MTSKSNVDLIVKHIDHYFASPQEEKMFTLDEMIECFNDSRMVTYHKNRTMSRVILEDYFKEKFGITINQHGNENRV